LRSFRRRPVCGSACSAASTCGDNGEHVFNARRLERRESAFQRASNAWVRPNGLESELFRNSVRTSRVGADTVTT
jgi:hypothetical protein